MRHGTGWDHAFGDVGKGLVVIRECELKDGGRCRPDSAPAVKGDFQNKLKAYKLWKELRLVLTSDGCPATAHD